MSWIKSTAFSHPRPRRGNYGEIFNRVCIIRRQHWILKHSHKWIKIYSILHWWYTEISMHLFKLAYFVSSLFSHMMFLLTVPPVLQLNTHIILVNCRKKLSFANKILFLTLIFHGNSWFRGSICTVKYNLVISHTCF